MRETSLLSYAELQPTLGERQTLVLQAIKTMPNSTALELANYLHHPDPNFCRPRITELTNKNLVESSGIRKCFISGRKVHTWRTTK